MSTTHQDHSKCAPGAHIRDGGDNTRQLGDPDGDGQLVDRHGRMLCHHCAAPMVYCLDRQVYAHLDPTTPDCFLVHEALAEMECEGCGGVLGVIRCSDGGAQVRYADPECAEAMGFTPTFMGEDARIFLHAWAADLSDEQIQAMTDEAAIVAAQERYPTGAVDDAHQMLTATADLIDARRRLPAPGDQTGSPARVVVSDEVVEALDAARTRAERKDQ